MKTIFVCLSLLGLAIAIPEDIKVPLPKELKTSLENVGQSLDSLDERGQIQFINDFIDVALSEWKAVMQEQNLDPMDVPDLYQKISYTIIITYWGSLNLTSGQVEGLSTIHRNGNVDLDYTDRVLTLSVPMAFEKFEFDYKYKVKIMGLGPRGGVIGNAKNIRFSFIIEVDFNELHLTLKKFDIEKVSSLGIRFTGNILVDWLINLLTGVISTLFKGLITWIIEKVVKSVLVSVIDQINNILAGLVNPEYIITSVVNDFSYIVA